MILRSTVLAFGLALATMSATPQVALAQSESDLANPQFRGDAPRRGWRGDGGGRWRDDRWREPPPRYLPQPEYYRPAPSYGGPNCRVVYRDDGWGGRQALRECQVCEPVWVQDGWGNRYRENRCRRVVQRLG
jgi:hypothetical protein